MTVTRKQVHHQDISNKLFHAKKTVWKGASSDKEWSCWGHDERVVVERAFFFFFFFFVSKVQTDISVSGSGSPVEVFVSVGSAHSGVHGTTLLSPTNTNILSSNIWLWATNNRPAISHDSVLTSSLVPSTDSLRVLACSWCLWTTG